MQDNGDENVKEVINLIQRSINGFFTGDPDTKLDFSNITSGENKELKKKILEEKNIVY